jgi:hypothetical protein
MNIRPLLVALAITLPTFAEEKPAAPSVTPEGAKVFAATDLAGLKAMNGKSATVEGTLAAQGENNSGTMRYLNFAKKYREALTLVFMVSKGGEEFSKEKLGAFVGKKVRVTGVISTYNEALQIKIDNLSQIQIQPEPAAPPQP